MLKFYHVYFNYLTINPLAQYYTAKIYLTVIYLNLAYVVPGCARLLKRYSLTLRGVSILQYPIRKAAASS